MEDFNRTPVESLVHLMVTLAEMHDELEHPDEYGSTCMPFRVSMLAYATHALDVPKTELPQVANEMAVIEEHCLGGCKCEHEEEEEEEEEMEEEDEDSANPLRSLNPMTFVHFLSFYSDKTRLSVLHTMRSRFCFSCGCDKKNKRCSCTDESGEPSGKDT